MSFATFLGFTIKANMDIKAALPGEVLTDPRQRELAKKLAAMVFSEKKATKNMAAHFADAIL